MLTIFGLSLAFIGSVLLTFYVDRTESHDGFILDGAAIQVWGDNVDVEKMKAASNRYLANLKRMRRTGFAMIAFGTAFQILHQLF